MKSQITRTKVAFIAMLFTTCFMFAQYSEQPADNMYAPVTGIINPGIETVGQTVTTRSTPNGNRPGIEGWYFHGSSKLDLTASGVETDPAHVFTGAQSLRVVTLGPPNNYDVNLKTDRIPINGTGTYIISFYTKTTTQRSSSTGYCPVKQYDASNVQKKNTGSGYTANVAAHTWQKVNVTFVVDDATVTEIDFEIQCNYFADTFWFDELTLVKVNSNTTASYYDGFNSLNPNIDANNNLVQFSWHTASNSLKCVVPYPTQSENWPGFAHAVRFSSLKVVPESAEKFVLRFRVKLENGSAGLYRWDTSVPSGSRAAEPQLEANAGIFHSEVKVFKNAGYTQVGSSQTVSYLVTDNDWVNCQVVFPQSYFDDLVPGDFISRVSISFGRPEFLYQGIAYVDELRFGFPQTVTNSAITATTIESGNGTFSVTPSRDCDLYAVPVGTTIKKSALDAAVTAGTGFKFEGLTGGQANVLTATYAMNSVGGIIEYQLVSYRSEEDFSNNTADKISVSKGTSTNIDSFTGKAIVTINSGIIQIVNSNTISQVCVYALNGQLVYTAQPYQLQHFISAEQLAKGVYLVKTTDINNQTSVSKISK